MSSLAKTFYASKELEQAQTSDDVWRTHWLDTKDYHAAFRCWNL